MRPGRQSLWQPWAPWLCFQSVILHARARVTILIGPALGALFFSGGPAAHPNARRQSTHLYLPEPELRWMLTKLVTKVKDKNKKKYTVQVLGP